MLMKKNSAFWVKCFNEKYLQKFTSLELWWMDRRSTAAPLVSVGSQGSMYSFLLFHEALQQQRLFVVPCVCTIIYIAKKKSNNREIKFSSTNTINDDLWKYRRRGKCWGRHRKLVENENSYAWWLRGVGIFIFSTSCRFFAPPHSQPLFPVSDEWKKNPIWHCVCAADEKEKRKRVFLLHFSNPNLDCRVERGDVGHQYTHNTFYNEVGRSGAIWHFHFASFSHW